MTRELKNREITSEEKKNFNEYFGKWCEKVCRKAESMGAEKVSMEVTKVQYDWLKPLGWKGRGGSSINFIWLINNDIKTLAEAETLRADFFKYLYLFCHSRLGESGDPAFAGEILKDFANKILAEINTETGGYGSSVKRTPEHIALFLKSRREELGENFPYQATQDKWTIIENYLQTIKSQTIDETRPAETAETSEQQDNPPP